MGKKKSFIHKFSIGHAQAHHNFMNGHRRARDSFVAGHQRKKNEFPVSGRMTATPKGVSASVGISNTTTGLGGGFSTSGPFVSFKPDSQTSVSLTPATGSVTFRNGNTATVCNPTGCSTGVTASVNNLNNK